MVAQREGSSVGVVEGLLFSLRLPHVARAQREFLGLP